VVGDDGLLLFHLTDDGQIVGVSGLGPASFAREFKIARLMAEAGVAPDPGRSARPGNAAQGAPARGLAPAAADPARHDRSRSLARSQITTRTKSPD
jgi:hypothetical protein